jgi:DNA polymerase-3 subunit beta
MHDLLRVLGDNDDDIKITHNEQQVLFRVGDIELVTRLVDGKYPDYRKLIPASFATQAVLKRGDLLNVTKVSSLFARESAGSITINLSEKDQLVSIRSVASQLGENTASANAEITGDGTITLNSRYVLDALNALHGDTVTFSFNGKLEPCVIADPAASDYLHVVMPLKS